MSSIPRCHKTNSAKSCPHALWRRLTCCYPFGAMHFSKTYCRPSHVYVEQTTVIEDGPPGTFLSSPRRDRLLTCHIQIGIEYAAQGQDGLLPALGPLGLPHKHTRELRDVLEGMSCTAQGLTLTIICFSLWFRRHSHARRSRLYLGYTKASISQQEEHRACYQRSVIRLCSLPLQLEQIDLFTLGARSSDKLVFVCKYATICVFSSWILRLCPDSGHGAQRDSDIPGDEEDDKDECKSSLV